MGKLLSGVRPSHQRFREVCLSVIWEQEHIFQESTGTQAIRAEVQKRKKDHRSQYPSTMLRKPHILHANYVAMFSRQANGLMLQFDAS